MRSYNPKHIDSFGPTHRAAPDAYGDTFHEVRRALYSVHRPPPRRDAGRGSGIVRTASPVPLKKPAPMTKMPDTLALDARRATPDDASLTDSIGATSTPLDLAAQQAGTQTLLRGLAILEAIANGARDMRAIGAALGTTRSTTHRLVSSLVQARYLRQVQGGYLLGPKLIELGTIALEQMPLTAVARPHLEALAEATLDTIHLGVRDGDDVLYIDKIPGTRGLEMRSRVGHRMPLASTGIGKAMMLDTDPDTWRSLFEAARRALAGVNFKPDNRPETSAFLQRMAHYAAGGYTFDLEENEASIRCVAAPIRDASGAIVAAVSVASTIPYMPHDRMDELIPLVQREARAISAELGWSPPQGTRRIKR
ncbi:IclR family transcriptional regulator [Burkholderia lata]|uniref:IclR family transcriptional regulator n=6 Tax=Burkholderia cepacia complex TaxID=87882 RepID=A0A6P2NYQ1_BURL3|nr:IclR family transcriptional regulator [Burkholderia lata]